MADTNEDVVFVPEPAAGAVPQTEHDALQEDAEQLGEIKTDLQHLKHLTGSTSAWFFRGMLQGAGAIIGSILMLILLGWVLSIVGIIPGFGDIAKFIASYLDKVTR